MTAHVAPIAPEPPGLPFIGHAWELLRRPAEFLTEATRTLGPSVSIRCGSDRTLVVSSPRAVGKLLVDRASQFTKGYPYLKVAFGEGLITADGDRWRAPRRVMNPFFKADAVGALPPIFVKLTAEMLDRWDERARRGETVDAHVDMTHLGFRIAGLALFGVDLAEDSAATCDAASAVLRALFGVGIRPVPIPMWIPTPLNRSLQRNLAIIDDVVRRITTKPPGAGETAGLMSCPIHGGGAGKLRDEQDVRDQAITLLLAGHETTANVLAWALMLLAKDSEEAERLRAKVAGAPDEDPVRPDAVPDLNCALFEAMRLYPPVWLIERRAAVDTEIDGYAVPAGWFVAAVPWVLHRDPALWPNPTEFVPARFLPEEVRKRDKHAFVPFGTGQRQCIGMDLAMVEMQVILSMILKRFRFRLAPAARIEPEFKITLRPRYGVPLELERC